MMTTTLGFLMGIAFTACDSRDKQTTPEDITDTSSPTETPLALTLTENDTQYSRKLWSYGILDAQIDESSITGTLNYEEFWEGADPHCATVLQLAGQPSDECNDHAPGNDWCYTYTLSASDAPAGCAFKTEEMGYNLANESAVGFIAYTTDGFDIWGDPVTNQLDYGFISDNGAGWSSLTDWSYQPPDISVDLGEYAIDFPLLFETCDEEQVIGISEMAVEEFNNNGVVECDFWDPMSDIWTVTLNAGDTLSAAVNTNEDSDVAISLVAPDGCLISDVEPIANCRGGGDCSSLKYNAEADGTYSLIVYGDWCSGDTVAYDIGAKVH